MTPILQDSSQMLHANISDIYDDFVCVAASIITNKMQMENL